MCLCVATVHTVLNLYVAGFDNQFKLLEVLRDLGFSAEPTVTCPPQLTLNWLEHLHGLQTSLYSVERDNITNVESL